MNVLDDLIFLHNGGVFLLLCVIVLLLLLLIDSLRRRLRGHRWFAGIMLGGLMIAPSAIYVLGPVSWQTFLGQIRLLLLYLSLQGALLALIFGSGYLFTYRGRSRRAIRPSIAQPLATPEHFSQTKVAYSPVEEGQSDVASGTLNGQAQIPIAWLVDTQSPQYAYPLLPGMTRIGRLPENDIKLDDPAVSRSHTQILEQNGLFFIQDLNSRSGTLLNEAPLRDQQQLSPGDIITLGDTSLRFTRQDNA